jgi:carboxypeptidase Q
MSIGTNGQPLQAEVLVVKSFDELKAMGSQAKGKIVVYNAAWVSYGATVAYRFSGATVAATYGAVAALVRSVTPFSIQTVHTGSSQTASIPCGSISVEDATQLQRMQDRGQKVVVEMMMEAHQEADVPSRNIIITVNGTDKWQEYVVIGGHIDSWDLAEGAMDDGAGAFVSWEAVRIISQLGLRPRRSIRAVMFVNEENGDRGGQAYARDHVNEMNRTSLAIETDAGTFSPFRLGFTGSAAALAIMENIGSTLLSRIGAGNVTVGGGGTDIGGMCNYGVPCAGLEVLDPRVGPYTNNPCLGFNPTSSQTYVGEIPDGYFWYHHTAADTIDKLDPTQLQLSAAAMGVWSYSVAQLDDLLPR